MLSLICLFLHQVPVERLDALAQHRDVNGLAQYLANPLDTGPLKILRTGGGYAAGSMGWHAKLLEPKDNTAKYIVLSTPILVEDAGELLFKVNSDNKLVYVPERESFGLRLDSHSFDVSFDLPAHKVSVTDQLHTTWTGRPQPHFMFRLSPTFRVTEVSDARHRAIPFIQAGGIVAVSPKAAEQIYNIEYSGSVDKPGFANVIGPSEATLSGTMWYPMIARHPATYDISIHSPQNWLALAQGDEVSNAIEGNERVTKYHMNLPVVWISATTGTYRRVTSIIDGRRFSTISPQATDDVMRAQNAYNAEVVDFYSKTFGPYPFKSWTTVDSMQFRNGVGALEAYSFATYPAGGLPYQDTHEPSHTWWGGIINNDYLASIWNESFADYSQVIFNRDRPIGNREERQRAYVPQLRYLSDFDAAPLAHSGQDIGHAATALGYMKGAFVLQVLEDELGTDTFLRTLKEWIRTNPVGHIGSWEDYEAVVDRVSGKDYTWFFNEWVRLPGLPSFTLSNGTWNDGKFVGKVTFSGPPYRIDTDAVAEFPDGARSYTRVSIDPANSGQFSFDCSQKPTVVALDPWQIIARRNVMSTPNGGIRRLHRDRYYLDPKNASFMKSMLSGESVASLPDDLDGVFVVGSPESVPALGPLCEKVGFHVSGNHLTYKGTTIDLNVSGALAVVDLGAGKQCLIGLGKCDKRPDLGKARLAVLDARCRLIRAETDPMEIGPLAIRL